MGPRARRGAKVAVSFATHIETGKINVALAGINPEPVSRAPSTAAARVPHGRRTQAATPDTPGRLAGARRQDRPTRFFRLSYCFYVLKTTRAAHCRLASPARRRAPDEAQRLRSGLVGKPVKSFLKNRFFDATFFAHVRYPRVQDHRPEKERWQRRLLRQDTEEESEYVAR